MRKKILIIILILLLILSADEIFASGLWFGAGYGGAIISTKLEIDLLPLIIYLETGVITPIYYVNFVGLGIGYNFLRTEKIHMTLFFENPISYIPGKGRDSIGDMSAGFLLEYLPSLQVNIKLFAGQFSVDLGIGIRYYPNRDIRNPNNDNNGFLSPGFFFPAVNFGLGFKF